MSAHTPGPWSYRMAASGSAIIKPTGDKEMLAEVRGKGAANEANAARIVACVNACEGIDDELLEPRMLGNQIAAKMAVIEERDALRAERDALRLEVERNGEAIKLVADQADAWRLERDALRAALQECVTEPDDSGHFLNDSRRFTAINEIARAALAQGGEK